MQYLSIEFLISAINNLNLWNSENPKKKGSWNVGPISVPSAINPPQFNFLKIFSQALIFQQQQKKQEKR